MRLLLPTTFYIPGLLSLILLFPLSYYRLISIQQINNTCELQCSSCHYECYPSKYKATPIQLPFSTQNFTASMRSLQALLNTGVINTGDSTEIIISFHHTLRLQHFIDILTLLNQLHISYFLDSDFNLHCDGLAPPENTYVVLPYLDKCIPEIEAANNQQTLYNSFIRIYPYSILILLLFFMLIKQAAAQLRILASPIKP